jgi:hypothetical protein
MTDEIREALDPVADAFDALGVDYRVGGSVASSALGIARSTLDIDLVADLRASHVAALVERLQADYYIDGDMIHEAIQRRVSFNVIHLATMVKVDVFVLGPRPFDRASFSRVIHEPLGDSRERSFPLTTPEDIVIRKLEWYRLGGGVSQRQWADIIGVLKLQGDALDLVHMAHWARELGVTDLLERAMAEAGVGSIAPT